MALSRRGRRRVATAAIAGMAALGGAATHHYATKPAMVSVEKDPGKIKQTVEDILKKLRAINVKVLELGRKYHDHTVQAEYMLQALENNPQPGASTKKAAEGFLPQKKREIIARFGPLVEEFRIEEARIKSLLYVYNASTGELRPATDMRDRVRITLENLSQELGYTLPVAAGEKARSAWKWIKFWD